MKLSSILLCASLAVALFKPAISAEAQPVINEFMASNTTTIMDEDKEYPDWIELYNPTDSSIDLTGYGLSDRPDNPYKWIFQNIILYPGEYKLVFASGKDRKEIPRHWETVINHGDEWKYFIGTSEPPNNWNSLEFNDSEWLSGLSSIGSIQDINTTYIPRIISFYVRKKFNIDDVANITHCLFQINYQYAFVAYINGHEIARANIGEVGTPPSYDENATKSISNKMIGYGGIPEVFEINTIKDCILPGENVLAIQIHNKTIRSDIFVIPFLTFGMYNPSSNPREVPEILNFSIPIINLHTNFKISVEH